MAFLPKIAHATNGAEDAVNSLVSKITQFIVLPIVYVVFMAAVVVFVWGVAQYLINSDDPDKRRQGQSHILWGIVGITIMVSVFGIIRFVAETVGQSSVIGF